MTPRSKCNAEIISLNLDRKKAAVVKKKTADVKHFIA
jgi:hypothetical protein